MKIPCAGKVCDLALMTGGSHLAAVFCKRLGDSSLQIWQAESAALGSHYVLDAAVSLPESPTAVAWLPSCAITPTVAVACSGSTLMFSQSHDPGWTVIAKLGSLGQPMGTLQLDYKGMPMVTAGNQLGSVSNLVQAHTGSSSTGSPTQLLQIPLGQLALELAGLLPEYAPAALALMIARGRISAARDVILHMLAWLTIHDASAHDSHSGVKASMLEQPLLPDAPLGVVLDKPCLGALSSLVDALPLSHPPAKTDNSPSAAGHVGTGAALPPASTPKQPPRGRSKPSADPYAFDASAFGMGTMAEEEQEEQPQPAGGADPYAFDATAFGGDQGQADDEAQLPPAQATKDPYAFDAGAFGFADSADEPQQPAPPATAPDPFAFDAGAFDFGTPGVQPDQEEQQDGEDGRNPSKPAAVPADPFAFDPGAFGFSGEEQPHQPHQATAPAAQSASATASADAVDPFAFNAEAFGFNTVPGEEEEQEAQPEVAPAEEARTAAAADPYAFDASAFGMDVSPEPDQAKRDDDGPVVQAKGGQDPYAFDATAFGMGPSSAPPQQGDHPKPPKTKTQRSTVKKPAAPTRQTPALPKAQPQSSSIQVYRPKKRSNISAQPAVLSASELGSLQRLLGTALSQSSEADCSEEPTSPTSPAGLTDRLTSALPPGLTPHSTTALLSIAHMLCDDPPLPAPPSSQQGGATGLRAGPGAGSSIPVDWPALDEAARKVVRAVQLAVCSVQTLSGESLQQSCYPSPPPLLPSSHQLTQPQLSPPATDMISALKRWGKP